MRLLRLPEAEAAFVLSLLLAPTGVLSALDCGSIQAEDHTFNLKALGGPHSVVTKVGTPPTHSNMTYTIDICQGLRRKGEVKEGQACPDGTRVCMIKHTTNDEGASLISEVRPIAGDLADSGGEALGYEATLLKRGGASDSTQDGLRLVLKGGMYPLEGPHKTPQRAIIDFVCDDKEGTEKEWTPDIEYASSSSGDRLRVRDDVAASSGEEQYLNEGAALIFVDYGSGGNENLETLKLKWLTTHACANKRDTGDDGEAHWGFFTWLIMIVFLGVAAYLIFGSWLNYNRYGARGWDLLPHGDTIRDIPYLVKDWTRKVLNTVQGSGSRGGYSAV